ncbi:hypothetical protein LTR39_002243 [Cryomyces antarcticus]|nr:hypothetical protein LTR39_002243 [Cryomyces antarcticus]
MIITTASEMRDRKNTNLSVSSVASTSSASSSSSKTSLHQALLYSPPPSPGLPALLPRHGKKVFSGRYRRSGRSFVSLCAVVLLLYVVHNMFYFDEQAQATTPSQTAGKEYEMISDTALPQHPTTLVLTDKDGVSKWTISIPAKHEFPLRPSEYQELCAQASEISRDMEEAKTQKSSKQRPSKHKSSKQHHGYYWVDPNFLDVWKAEAQGLLPNPQSKDDAKQLWEDMTSKGEETKNLFCKKSLTYVMETTDAGFGNTLLSLWMSYGLAQTEGRAFFIDDTRWPYGRYTSYFLPPPSQDCLAPPKHQILPCPHHARHLLVSAATASQTLGHALNEEFEDRHKTGVARQHRIFALLRTGYEALFHIIGDDANYLETRTREISASAEANGDLSIGVHIRRGDCHPHEFQFSRDYLPLDRYIEAAREMLVSHRSSKNSTTDDVLAQTSPTLLLSSDDPEMYFAPELAPFTRAQDRIILANTAALHAAAHPPTVSQQAPTDAPSPYHKHVDENSGWEGGFFKLMFWSLGRSTPTTSPRAHGPDSSIDGDIPDVALRMRELVGRAYLLDLAVLGRSDRVICAVSATGCRILAVMMGWENGIVQGGWRNVDGPYEWRGIV